MFTFAVFTCNRLHYLKNCINSILEFIDVKNIDLLVVDNRTSEDGMDEYLKSLPSYILVKRFNDPSPHELHRAMNWAIQWSMDKGNKYINFVQDDYQYLYSQPDFLNRVKNVFEKFHDVAQVHTNLVWKRKHDRIGKFTIRDVNGVRWFWTKNKPPCDNGFTRVSIFDKIGFFPSHTSVHGDLKKGYISGETWLASKAERLGYQRFMSAEPNMGMIFDCAYVRGKSRKGKYFPPPNKYYLKPFSNEKIIEVQEKSKNGEWCFIEDMIEADGWVPECLGKHSISLKQTEIGLI